MTNTNVETLSDNVKETTLRTVLAACRPEDYRVARMWLYYTLFYWLLPTLIVVFGFWVAGRRVNWWDLVIHGEFLIYSITLAAGSTRLIAKDIDGKKPFCNRQAFNLWAQIMIFPAIFTYGLVRFLASAPGVYSINSVLVATYSVLLLIAAFGFSYLVFLVDAQRGNVSFPREVAQTIQHSADKINADFDAIQEAAASGGDAPAGGTV